MAVTVSRSGGIAGMTRHWAVQSRSDEDAAQWRDLVDTTNDPVISARRPKG